MNTNFANVKMHHATRAKADRLAEMLKAEYPALVLAALAAPVPGDDLPSLQAWKVWAGDTEVLVTEDKKLPELADILEAADEAGIDPEEGAEDEEEAEASGSVVKSVYRKIYSEVSSNKQTCGDWLAEQLVNDTTDGDGKLNVETLIFVLEANGVDLDAKWAQARFTQSHGWKGRFRMSGRIVLEKLVTLRGVYIGPEGEIAPDPEWLADMQAKHAKWIAKMQKKSPKWVADMKAKGAE